MGGFFDSMPVQAKVWHGIHHFRSLFRIIAEFETSFVIRSIDNVRPQVVAYSQVTFLRVIQFKQIAYEFDGVSSLRKVGWEIHFANGATGSTAGGQGIR